MCVSGTTDLEERFLQNCMHWPCSFASTTAFWSSKAKPGKNNQIYNSLYLKHINIKEGISMLLKSVNMYASGRDTDDIGVLQCVYVFRLRELSYLSCYARYSMTFHLVAKIDLLIFTLH